MRKGPLAGRYPAAAALVMFALIPAAVSAGALVLSLLTFEDSPPADPSAPRDPAAIALAAAGWLGS